MTGETQPHGSVHTLPGGPARGDTTRRTSEVLPLPGQAPALPDRIGGYRVVRELGRGGMGVVYLAENLGLRRQVALKVLPGGADLEAVERFQLEARTAARVKHPNVVGVHEVGRDGDRWFLAMDLVDGESLRARVQRDGPLDPREAARIVEAVARALHEAHTLGVLHRDVKPHNILLARDGTPLLADFGLARDTGQQGITVTGEVMGTPAYMAPEQAAGDRARVDRRADVYAAGATLYEALTGQPPFQGPTALHILAQVTADPPRPPSALRPGLDRELETVVLECLEKEPAARYDTAGELADDLGRWLRHEPLVARRPGLALRAAKLARRRPLLAAAVALGAVVAVAAGAAELARAAERGRAEAARRRQVERARDDALEAVEAARVSSDARASATAYEAALVAVRRWRDEAPGDEAALRLLLEVTVAAGDAHRVARPSEVNDAYVEACRLQPDDPVRAADLAAATLMTEAHGLLRRGVDQKRALEAALEATRLRPRWVEPWTLLSEVQRQTQDLQGALVSLDEATRLGGEHAALLLQRACVLNDLKDARAALRAVDEALALEPDWVDALYNRSGLRLRVGDVRGALADLTRLIELQPSSILYLCERGELRGQLGDPGFVEDFEEVTRRAPQDARGWIGLSAARAQAGLLPQAMAAADRAIEVAPHLGRAWLQRGRVHVDAHDLPSALRDTAEAVRRSPDDPDVVFAYAGLLTSQDPSAAVEVLTRTLETGAPGFLASLVRRAEARRRLRDFEGAVRDAEAAMVISPDSPDAYAIRGYARANQERVPEAIADLERALQLRPDHPDAGELRRALEMLRQHR